MRARSRHRKYSSRRAGHYALPILIFIPPLLLIVMIAKAIARSIK